VINDVLDFSKIEAGKLDIESIGFVLDSVAEDVATVVAHKINEKALELIFDVAPDVPQGLIGDPLRIGQILTNLINNAAKFTEKGEVVVRVRQLQRRDLRVLLQFSVSDSGIGMTQAQCDKLFRPFTQADGSTTRKYGGTGLGLAICKRLVELMEGEISADSEPGKGSLFTFTAWLGIGDLSHQRVLPEQLNGMRVLIVDDNPAARAVLAGHCSELPILVDEVSSGAEAVAAVRKAAGSRKPYGLVLMDWSMPGLNGIDAARTIKEGDGASDAPAVVIVTAFGREDIKTEAEQAALDGFLIKPVRMSTLTDTLVSLFFQQQEAGAAVAQQSGEQVYRFADLRVLLVEDNPINQQIAVELMEGVASRWWRWTMAASPSSACRAAMPSIWC